MLWVMVARRSRKVPNSCREMIRYDGRRIDCAPCARRLNDSDVTTSSALNELNPANTPDMFN